MREKMLTGKCASKHSNEISIEGTNQLRASFSHLWVDLASVLTFH